MQIIKKSFKYPQYKMGSVEYGAKQAIENCLKVKEGEKIVIITDYKSLVIATVLKNAAQKKTKQSEFYVLNYSSKTSEEKILNAMEKANVSIYCSSRKSYKKAGEFVDKLFEIAQKNKIRHAHMPCITKEIMKTGMCADYSEIQRITKKLCKIVNKHRKIRFTTKKGTDITAKFSPGTRWFSHDGSFEDEIPIENLPTGNLSASPNYIEGMLVIDGYIGSYLNKKYGNIEDTPLGLEIEKSRVVEDSVKCKNKRLEKEFKDYILKTDENSSRIGAFIMGTNIGLENVIGNLLQDEKLPGVHILFGSPSYFPLNNWSSKVICDSWIKDTTIIGGCVKIMENGKFLV